MPDTHPTSATLPSSLLILLPAESGELISHALDLFTNRMQQRWNVPCRTLPAAQIPGQVSESESVLLLCTGKPEGQTAQILQTLNLEPPDEPESYLLYCGSASAGVPRYLVCAADAHGMLYGLGRLLHNFQPFSNDLEQPHTEIQIPTTRQRGIYFATHFQNFYEGVPLDILQETIEELALWGFNLLFSWFDMSWYPEGFWDDPTSSGMRMIERLRFIAKTARACGMRVGTTAIANEGFRSQPPLDLRADPSVRRGGFYLESQICPSKPGGMEMILRNRRKVLELLGEVDFYWHWPYDQGGCGCEQCSSPTGVRWGGKFLELGQVIADLVREFNPQAKFILSTWLMDAEEHAMIEDLCRQGADWFDGVLYETHTLDDHPLPTLYERMVFPEISMFDCYFTSYGCNGANPAPRRFAEQARQTVRAGAGAAPYSEGMYEDINKITWSAILWNPQRDIEDIVTEYAGYYLSAKNTGRAAELIFELEDTWGAVKLRQVSPQKVKAIREGLDGLEADLPEMRTSRLRWQSLRDRAEIDWLMKQIPTDEALIGEARFLMDEAGCTDDLPSLRRALAGLCEKLDVRQAGVERLFEAHWAYMERFYMQRTSLIFLPDDVTGGRDFEKLLVLLHRALAEEQGESMRTAAMRAFKRWLWLNGIRIEHLFL